MAKSRQETAGVLGALGAPLKLTCGIALSLAQALEVSSELLQFLNYLLIQGMVVNCQMSSDLAKLALDHDSRRAGRSCKGRRKIQVSGRGLH